MKLMTTDKRYLKVGDDAWWDTHGIDIVSTHEVDAYLDDNPCVGIMALMLCPTDMPPMQ